MGKQSNYINLTGCRSIENISDGINLFKDVSHVNQILNLKINSITFTLHINISNISDITENKIPVKHFAVKRFPKFSGICFKHLKTRISGNYFHSSKTIVCMGGKNKADINKFTRDLTLLIV